MDSFEFVMLTLILICSVATLVSVVQIKRKIGIEN